ncbi:cytochrome P450 [Saccharata proteae CBS 121410]|uniref:Cytochrome P450 n=1 Tax=Saccharata proteae CBS 121410 TaxID=1314787 RepID=A0A9P4HYV9_9PEZI|nr:cytochrome P450 [Saccharata proteae CBS 121410]
MAILASLQQVMPTSVGLLSLVASLTAVYFFLLSIYRLTLHPFAKYPGPFLAKISPFHAFTHAVKGDIHIDMYNCHQKYGDIVRYRPNSILVNTSEGFKDIYGHGKNIRKSDDYSAFPDNPGAYSTHSAINKIDHGRKRRILSQGLGDNALAQVEPTIINLVGKFCSLLTGSTEAGEWSKPVDMANIANYLTFDVMSDLVFGTSYEMLDRPDKHWITTDLESGGQRAGIIFQFPLFAYLKLDRIIFPRMSTRQTRFRRSCQTMANDRMSNPASASKRDVFGNVIAAVDPETGTGFPIQELWSESILLIVAGSDTSSTVLAALSFYLAKNPAIQRRAAEEVRGKFGGAGEIRTGAALSGCVFLRACLDEAMRMSPPVGGAMWRTVQKGGARVGGEGVGEGMDVGTGTYAVMHNETYFPDPFTYNPDRWIVSEKGNPKESVERARAVFAPFSIGPRGCVGKSLAYMTMMLAAARMLYEYDLRFADPKDGEKKEYELLDAFTSIKRGPMIEFCKIKRVE